MLHTAKPRTCLIVALFWPIISAASAPEAIAIWSERKANEYVIYTSIMSEEEWSAPINISSSKNRILGGAIGSNHVSANASDDNAVINSLAIWTEVIDQQWVLKYSDSRDGTWTTPKKFSSLGGENLSPIIVHDLNNTVWVFWSSNVRGNDDIYLKRRINGQWSSAELVNEKNETPDILPRAFLDKHGNVAVAWNSFDKNLNSYVLMERVFQSASQDDSKADQRSKPQTPEAIIMAPPPSATNANRVNLHFPKNTRDQSIYVQPN